MKKKAVAAGVLILLVVLLGVHYWPRRVPRELRTQNALWMGHRWSGKAPRATNPSAIPPQPPPEPQEVTEVATSLARRGFRDLYIHVGPLDAKGAIPAGDPAAWQRIRDELRARIPGVRLFAYVGGITEVGWGKAPDTLDLSRPAVRAAVTATSVAVVNESGFDGLHYDIEPIPNNDADFLKLLDETRPALKGRPLSVAAVTWHHTYMLEVGRRCDQIALMSYDLALPTAEAYQQAMEQIVPAMSRICAEAKCRFLMGVPAYLEKSNQHDPRVENVDTALRGVRLGVLTTADTGPFQGVAIYAHWTMNEEDWQAYDRLWAP